MNKEIQQLKDELEQLKNETEMRVIDARLAAMGCTWIACCEELDKGGDPKQVDGAFFDNIQNWLSITTNPTKEIADLMNEFVKKEDK